MDDVVASRFDDRFQLSVSPDIVPRQWGAGEIDPMGLTPQPPIQPIQRQIAVVAGNIHLMTFRNQHFNMGLEKAVHGQRDRCYIKDLHFVFLAGIPV